MPCASPAPDSEAVSTSGARVLVVDDEDSIVDYLTVLLEDHGYETLSASNADEAETIACEARPDLICMDIMMPGRSGIALYRDLKRDARARDIPVIFVSAFSQSHELPAPRFFRQVVPEEDIPPPQGYLEKPISIDGFLKLVAKALKGQTGEPPAPEGTEAT